MARVVTREVTRAKISCHLKKPVFIGVVTRVTRVTTFSYSFFLVTCVTCALYLLSAYNSKNCKREKGEGVARRIGSTPLVTLVTHVTPQYLQWFGR